MKIRGASDDLVIVEGVCDLVTKCPTCGHTFEASIGIAFDAPDGTPIRWEVTR
jgi:hypothetical protein